MRPSLSLLSTYLNNGPTIDAHIKSLAEEVRGDIEWVMVDSGSSDGTWERCIAAERQNKQIRAYQVRRGGFSPVVRGEGRDIAARLSGGGLLIHAIDGDVIYRRGIVKLIRKVFEERKLGAMPGDSYFAVLRDVYESVNGYPFLQVEEDFTLYRTIEKKGFPIEPVRINGWQEDHNRVRPLRNLAKMGTDEDRTEAIR